MPCGTKRCGGGALVVLLTAVLISQWTIGWREHRESARRLEVLRSIEGLMKQHNESEGEIIASIDDMADVLDDVHSHLTEE